jgi:hypothetical protein
VRKADEASKAEESIVPSRDDNPAVLTPIVTIVLILANIGVWWTWTLVSLAVGHVHPAL